MSRITLQLPDDVVEKARQEGLLSERAISSLLEEAARISAMRRLAGMWRAVPAEDQAAPSDDELQAIIRAVRRQRLA